MKIGVQIYGCLPLCKQNPEQFLANMAAAGYGDIEPCIAFGIKEAPAAGSLLDAVWKPSEMEYYLRILHKNGLTLTSAHVFADDPLSCLAEMRRTAQASGIKAYVLNCPEKYASDNYAEFADICLAVSEALAEDGIETWLHNSHAEIRAKVDGVSVYEKILVHAGGKLLAQPDVGWILYGGADPIDFLQRIRPYLASIHYKDIKKGYADIPPQNSGICLGEGTLDTKSIWNFCKDLPVGQLVDQDSSDGDILADLAASAKYLHSLA